MANTKPTANRLSVKAVLFDLDDTLFDHQYSSRNGLAAVQQTYPCFQQKTLEELEHNHLQLLNHLHPKVLWLNRYSLSCPNPDLAAEINSFEPLDTVLELLLKER
jgi:FMN phosphatase YigB (HAD superfamily)